jgi:hypothetical protein
LQLGPWLISNVENNFLKWERSWNETTDYFNGAIEREAVVNDLQKWKSSEEKLLRWKRCRDKKFLLRLGYVLLQHKDISCDNKSEAEFLK